MNTTVSLLLAAASIFTLPIISPASVQGDIDTLAAYIEGAVSGESLDVMCAVGAVILNRSAAGLSIVSEGAALGTIPSPSPSPMARYAATLAVGGFDLTGGAVVFFREDDADALERYGKLVTYSHGGYSFAVR